MKTKTVDSAKTQNKIKGKVGKPTVMTQETLTKLQYAFSIGATDREACLFAEINPDTLYEHQKRNPDYAEQKEAWKEKPIFQARQAVLKQIQGGVGKEPDGDLALKYLERKKKDEFAPKATLDLGVTAELDKKLEDIKNFIFPETTKKEKTN